MEDKYEPLSPIPYEEKYDESNNFNINDFLAFAKVNNDSIGVDHNCFGDTSITVPYKHESVPEGIKVHSIEFTISINDLKDFIKKSLMDDNSDFVKMLKDKYEKDVME